MCGGPSGGAGLRLARPTGMRAGCPGFSASSQAEDRSLLKRGRLRAIRNGLPCPISTLHLASLECLAGGARAPLYRWGSHARVRSRSPSTLSVIPVRRLRESGPITGHWAGYPDAPPVCAEPAAQRARGRENALAHVVSKRRRVVDIGAERPPRIGMRRMSRRGHRDGASGASAHADRVGWGMRPVRAGMPPRRGARRRARRRGPTGEGRRRDAPAASGV